MSADSRFARRLAALAANGRKALVPFITAGDPGRDATVPVLHALVAAGADLIELGVPFSDPMADGVVIQKSSERALERGINAPAIFAIESAMDELAQQKNIDPVEFKIAQMNGGQPRLQNCLQRVAALSTKTPLPEGAGYGRGFACGIYDKR